MPNPIAFQREQSTSEGQHGQSARGPELFYVLYDDGSIRRYRPDDPRVGGSGEWHQVAPPDEYAVDE